MSDDEPHRIEDNAPAGNTAIGSVTVRRPVKKKRRQKIIVSVGFDENQKEFELWDYLYSAETEYFELDAFPDYKNRIQYYTIAADYKAMREFRLWLMQKEIKYKLTK